LPKTTTKLKVSHAAMTPTNYKQRDLQTLAQTSSVVGNALLIRVWSGPTFPKLLSKILGISNPVFRHR